MLAANIQSRSFTLTDRNSKGSMQTDSAGSEVPRSTAARGKRSTLEWREVVAGVPGDEAAYFLETFKQYKTMKSNAVPCTVCTVVDPHTMRYQILACASMSCQRVAPYAVCSWRGRVLACSKSTETTLHECGDHFSHASDEHREKLTKAQKSYLREMAAQGLKPSRIRNSMPRKFGVELDDLPSLAKVQSYINYYRKTKLMNNDRYEDLLQYIRGMEFTGREADTQPFVFGRQLDRNGELVVGDGSDEEPFLIGITTKCLLARLDRPVDSFILHMDATFKLNQVGYPVFVCGISDRCRSFHLVALFVVSQRLETQYVEALSALRRVYTSVMNKQLSVRFIMGDADDAQYNAFLRVFGSDNTLLYLMCFYHVIAKVIERTKGLSGSSIKRITRDIYNIHFSRSADECVQVTNSSIAAWLDFPETKDFAQYFARQWLQGKFFRWQCFYTASGYATTNNPVEQFNKTLKRDYTLRSRLKMGTLLMQLVDCCRNESSSTRAFKNHIEPTNSLKRRVNELVRETLLFEVVPAPTAGVLDGVGAGIKYVVTRVTPRVLVQLNKRSEDALAVSAQMGENYARMETEGQTQWGWPVDVARRLCPCRYFFKFGQCIHLLHIMQKHKIVDFSGQRTLVYRGPSRKRKHTDVQSTPAGRPALNGYALSME